ANRVFCLGNTLQPTELTLYAYEYSTLHLVDTLFLRQQDVGEAYIGTPIVWGNQLMFAGLNSIYVVSGPFASGVGQPVPEPDPPNVSDLTGNELTAIDQNTNDMVWDPVSKLFYLSITVNDPVRGNTVASLSPDTRSIVRTQPLFTDPF